MIISYLILMCVLSVLNLCILSLFYQRRVNLYFLAVFGFIIVANFGHLLLALSSTLEGVIFANKVCYLGSCFLPLFEYFVIVRLCKFKFPKWGKAFLTMVSLTIFGLSCTIGYSDIYYESVEFINLYGVGGYRPTYGPMHELWVVMLGGYAILNILTIVYAAKKRLNVSYKTLLAITMLCFITVASFVISCTFNNDTLVMPVVYIIDEFILLFICVRVKMYDISSSVLDSLVAENTCAFVAFSVKGVYLGCNDVALKFFAELDDYRVDQAMPEKGHLSKIFASWMKDLAEGKVAESYHFAYNANFYKSTLKNVKRRNISRIYLFKIEDETSLRCYVDRLGASNTKLENLLKSNVNHIHAIQEQMIVGMARMVESRDLNTGGHIKRTSDCVAILVEEMKKDTSLNYSEEFYDALVASAPMHDLGKIAIDDQVLRKLGKFTDDEFNAMKTHAEKGANIVENLLAEIETPFFVKIARNVACSHHERWDGSGYPYGLEGESIPFEARIMAVADVYDALVSNRSYKDKQSLDFAFNEILNSMGTKFDPCLKPYFIRVRPKLESYYSSVDH
ncbi:HD domain-containing phosphohydrolase [Fibrobacter sp.]|uniref:HD domain-containing phosphohydrolase n=1 Tax=Fibrobacter sp. TaxID=35828 RepID=UPI00388EFB09